MNKILLFILTLSFLILGGCSQGPDFTEKFTIIEKSACNGKYYYKVKQQSGGNTDFFPIEFYAPQNFGDVGNELTFDGKSFKLIQVNAFANFKKEVH